MHMVVYFGGLKRAKEMYYGGHKIKEAWYGGKLVYTSHSPIKGFEAFFDTLDRDGYSFEIGLPETKIVTTEIKGTTRDFHIHALCGDDASIMIEQTGDGRKPLDLKVGGGKVTVKSTGDRGKNNLDFSGDWPGGTHILSVSASSHWYGYSMQVLVDGVSIGSQSNGGGFTLSENLFTPGEARTTLTGCSARQPLSTRSISSSRKRDIADAIQHGVTWRVLTEPWSGSFAVPGGQLEAWIYSGGEGGRGGGTSYSGSSGAGGAGRYVGPVVDADLATLTPGEGGSGGRGTGVSSSGDYGSSGSASTIQLSDGRTIDSRGGSRPTPAVRGVKFPGSLPGGGGSGGNSSENGGSSGSSGGKGGLVVARYW